jgi:hypothetical protein
MGATGRGTPRPVLRLSSPKRAARKMRKIQKNKIFFRVIHSKTHFPKIALRIWVTKRAAPPV